MRGKVKNIISKWYSLVVVVLVLALTIFSLMPVVKLNVKEEEYPDIYKNGKYTSMIEDYSEVKVGVGSVFKFAKHFKDVAFVVSVQSCEKNIEKTIEKIEEYEQEESFNNESQYYNDLKLELTGYNEKLEKTITDYGEENIGKLIQKLENDKEFRSALKLSYCLSLYIDNENVSSRFGLHGFLIIESLINFLCLVGIIGLSTVFVIIFIIKTIIKIIQYLINIKKEQDELFIKKLEKFPLVIYMVLLTIFVVVLIAFSRKDISLGVGIIGVYITLGIFTIIRLIKNYVYSKNKDINILVKKSVSVVSLILFVIFLCTFIKIDLIKEYGEVMVDISNSHFNAEYAKGIIPGVNLEILASRTYGKVSDSNSSKIALLILGTIAFLVLSFINLFRFISRTRKEEFGEGKIKNKTKAIFVIPAILLVLSIVPTMLSGHSQEEMKNAYETGTFKIWYGEYLVEGSSANLEYNAMLITKDAIVEQIEELKNSKETDVLEEAKKELKNINKMIKETEQRAERPKNIIVIGSFIILSEIVYVVVPKCIGPSKEECETGKN